MVDRIGLTDGQRAQQQRRAHPFHGRQLRAAGSSDMAIKILQQLKRRHQCSSAGRRIHGSEILLRLADEIIAPLRRLAVVAQQCFLLGAEVP